MPKITLNIKKSHFNAIYEPFVKSYTKRYEIYFGGAGSGKSVFIAQKLIIKALSSKRKILIIRKYATTLKDSCYQLIIDILSKWKIIQYCNINKSTLTIELINGSIILFKGMDDSEKIKSITNISDIWIEESTEISEDDFTQLDLRLRGNAGNLQLYCSFNPVSKVNWVYKKWFSNAAYDKENTMILHTTYKDNRFLPKEYIEALEEKINSNPTYYRIYALGEFASLDKLIFNNYIVAPFNHYEIKGELLVGLDFGFVNDVSALIAAILDEPNKRIYIFKSWGDTNKTNEELANIISSLGFAKSVIVADSAEMKSIEEIRRKGISKIKPAVKGKDSILHGIQKLQQYKIIIHPSCAAVITEFENYSWKKDSKSNEYINQPIDKFNHYIDALRYSLQCVEDKKKMKTLNKSLLGL